MDPSERVAAEAALRQALPPATASHALHGDDGHVLARALRDAYEKALRGDSKLTPAIRAIPGMSGQAYRSTINNLIGALDQPRYLEIGCLAGSTAAAAMFGNRLACVCIDNWSEFGGPKQEFAANTRMALSDQVDFRFIESDFRQVDYTKLGSFNIFLFDGPHQEQDHYDSVALAQPCLMPEHILVVDDWNWQAVRMGTLRALRDLGSQIVFGIEIRTTHDDSHARVRRGESQWHNGYFMALIRKAL